MSLLRARGLAVGHGGAAVVRGVDLEVERGQRWLVLGPNGSGKTTLLRTLLGLLPPLAGKVTRSGRAAYLAQASAVPGHVPLTVKEVVAMGGRATPDLHARLDVPDGSFFSLSGGQRGRVLLARTLAGAPDLLVLDEPTAHVDQEGEEALYRLLDDGFDGAALIATHHRGPADRWATHRLWLSDGLARVEARA